MSVNYKIRLRNGDICMLSNRYSSYIIRYKGGFITNHLYNYGSSIEDLIKALRQSVEKCNKRGFVFRVNARHSIIKVHDIDEKTLEDLVGCMRVGQKLIASAGLTVLYASKFSTRDIDTGVPMYKPF